MSRIPSPSSNRQPKKMPQALVEDVEEEFGIPEIEYCGRIRHFDSEESHKTFLPGGRCRGIDSAEN